MRCILFSFLVSVSGVSTVGHTFYKHMFQLVPEARKLPLGGRNRQGFMMGVNRWLAVPHMYTDQKDISTLGLYLLFFRWSPVEVLRYQRICRIQLLFTFDVSYPARVTRVNTSLASVSIIPTLLTDVLLSTLPNEHWLHFVEFEPVKLRYQSISIFLYTAIWEESIWINMKPSCRL